MKRYYQVTIIDNSNISHSLIIYARNAKDAERFAIKDFDNLYYWTAGIDYRIESISEVI